MGRLNRNSYLALIIFGLVVAVAAGILLAIAFPAKNTTPSDDVSHTDPPPPTVMRLLGAGLAVPPVACVPDTQEHVELWIVNSSSTVSAASVRSAFNQMNAYINANDPGASIKTLCDSSGLPTVQITPNFATNSFDDIVNAVRSVGGTRSNARYDIVCGCASPGGYSGIAQLGSLTGGPYYAVTHGVIPETMLHELTHTLSAVQGSQHAPAAPNSTWAGHCKDEYDIMCYYDGGGNALQILVCRLETKYDCNGDDYANANPPPGWLHDHPEFNLLSCNNKYYAIPQCGTVPPPPTTTTTTTTPPPTTSTSTSTSTTTTSTTTSTTTPPPSKTPTGVRVSTQTCAYARVSWYAVSGATSYTVAKRFNGGLWVGVANVSPYSQTIAIAWSANGKYDFRVRTNTSTGPSAYAMTTATRSC